MTQALVNILRRKRLNSNFEIKEKIRIEKTIGQNGSTILRNFAQDPALEDDDVYQILVLEILRLVNKYSPHATFATFITRYLRWNIAHIIRSSTQLKTYVILYKEYTYNFYGDMNVVVNRLSRWHKQLLLYIIDGLSVRDMGRLTCYSKSYIHNETLEIRSRLEI